MSTDPAILQAVPVIKAQFEDSSHRARKTVRYIGQLQVVLEDTFFPWIIYNATMELCGQGQLSQQITQTKHADKVTFVYHSKFTQADVATRIRNTAKLIDRYSRPEVAHALGKHLEALVRAELRAQGFTIAGVHTNQYGGLKWTETNHNLDMIAEHASGRLNIGVEVKNTLSVPEREEIETKIRLCKYLQIVPVFATRWMKPYVKLIYDEGGFSWFFKTQIYPLGFEKLTRTIWEKLHLPVNVRTDLPEKTIPIIRKWVSDRT